MKHRLVGRRCLVKGEPGDRLPDLLVALAKQYGWKSGSVAGLGGVTDVRLAYFDVVRKEYLPIDVPGIVELISLTGNLSTINDAPMWHLHAAVSDRDGRMTAGHLVSLVVAVTLECWIEAEMEPVTRRKDEATGLNLLDL